MVLLSATAGVATLSQALDARHRAAAAADLGALAAATRLGWSGTDAAGQTGAAGPCALAERVVVSNGALLVRCTISGREVVVAARVSVRGAGALLGLPDPVRLARAGPAPPG